MRLDQLPSRPFTIGYVRAYAQVLGLDPEAAVARFKQDAPDAREPLRAPVGVRREGDPRLALIAVGGAVVVAGVVLWNVAKRTVVGHPPSGLAAASAPAPASAAKPASPIGAPIGPMALGAPLPAPPESTTPKPYITPGLPPPSDAGGVASSQAAAALADAAETPPAVFTPRGVVYGAPPDPSAVILQAKHAALVVVHGADGSVYFARELAAGEAYRAPGVNTLSIDVSDPQAFDVFVAGAFKGALPAAKMPLSQLTQ